MLSGLCDWLDNILVIPAKVDSVTEEIYLADPDPIRRFLAACMRLVIGLRVQSTILHELCTA